jgi:rRNA maturation protein Rpf1
MSTYKSKNSNFPHFGNWLKAYIKENKIHNDKLAKKLNRKLSTLNGYKKRKSVQSAIVWELSMALEHNIFAELAAQLPQNFSQPDDINSKAIEELKVQVAQLTNERNLLKEILMNRK